MSRNDGTQRISKDAVWRLEVPSDSLLSEDIENAKIDTHLKIPSIEQFDGRMSFFGHAEIARCRFFCTCLNGTTLEWFNNLSDFSIESWRALKRQTRGLFISTMDRKIGAVNASKAACYDTTSPPNDAVLTVTITLISLNSSQVVLRCHLTRRLV